MGYLRNAITSHKEEILKYARPTATIGIISILGIKIISSLAGMLPGLAKGRDYNPDAIIRKAVRIGWEIRCTGQSGSHWVFDCRHLIYGRARYQITYPKCSYVGYQEAARELHIDTTPDGGRGNPPRPGTTWGNIDPNDIPI